jgi:hypothetical protein
LPGFHITQIENRKVSLPLSLSPSPFRAQRPELLSLSSELYALSFFLPAWKWLSEEVLAT